MTVAVLSFLVNLYFIAYICMKLRNKRNKKMKKQNTSQRSSSTNSSNNGIKDYINPAQNDLESSQIHVEVESNHQNEEINANEIPLKNGSINKA